MPNKYINSMKKFLLLAFILICCGKLLAQQSEKLSCFINLPNDSLRLLEPLRLEIILTNNSTTTYKDVWPLTNNGISFHYMRIFLEYKSYNETRWNKIELPNLHRNRNYPGEHSIVFLPGDTLRSGLFGVPGFLITERNKLNKIQIRLALQPRISKYINNIDTSPFITSIEKTIYFVEYSGDEDLIYERLFNLEQPDFMYMPFFYGSLSFNCKDAAEESCPYVSIAQEITKIFPHSEFAPWCQLYLAIQYDMLSQIQFSISPEKSQYYLNLAYKEATSLLNQENEEIVNLAQNVRANIDNTIRVMCKEKGDLEFKPNCYLYYINLLNQNIK